MLRTSVLGGKIPEQERGMPIEGHVIPFVYVSYVILLGTYNSNGRHIIFKDETYIYGRHKSLKNCTDINDFDLL
jgi:hypothetical protein